MSFERPKNLIIADATIAAYKAWLRMINESEIDIPDEEVKSLLSTTVCRLLANNECVDKVNCSSCPAAKETFAWARKKLQKDGVSQSTYPSESLDAYVCGYPEQGKMSMSAAIDGHSQHSIHFEVEDGYFAEEGQQGLVTVFVS